MASKYEDIGENATEYFKRRARLMSVIVAIALAFSLNVNAIHLFKTFLLDKTAREMMISQGAAVAENLQAQEKELKKAIEKQPPDEQQNLENINKNIQEFRDSAKTLSAAGIPIGWDTAPWNTVGWVKISNPVNEIQHIVTNSLIVLSWIGSVMLAGLLIGLGGPFWFDTFRKLSTLTGVIRGFQTPVQEAKEPKYLPRAKIESSSEIKPDVVAIFETAAKANALGDFGGRVLLTPEGNIDQGGIL